MAKLSIELRKEYEEKLTHKQVNRGTYIEPAVNHTINHLDEIVITEEMDTQQLEFLNVTKSSGHDSIQLKLSKDSKLFFFKPLYIFFTQCTESYPVVGNWLI